MKLTDTKPTKEQIKDARLWLMDCSWPDATTAQIKRMSADQVIRAVARHYDGGIAGFIADAA